jgi:hypothetical protein
MAPALVTAWQGGSGGELVGGSASVVAVEGDGVDDEGVAEEVEVLAGGAEAVGAAEVEGVVEVAVDGLGVVAAPVEAGEVGVTGGDGPQALGAVESAGPLVARSVPHQVDVSAPSATGTRMVTAGKPSGHGRSLTFTDTCIQRRIHDEPGPGRRSRTNG